MHCFKKAATVSAARYLSHIRIHAACEALSATEKKFSEIAFCRGYENHSSFNRQFKEIMGCSPNEYRKQELIKCCWFLLDFGYFNEWWTMYNIF